MDLQTPPAFPEAPDRWAVDAHYTALVGWLMQRGAQGETSPASVAEEAHRLLQEQANAAMEGGVPHFITHLGKEESNLGKPKK